MKLKFSWQILEK